MARTSVLTTRVLLTTAAIGVATGLLAGVAGWVTPLVLGAAPILYGFVLGAHVLPGIIAQEVIRLPWVALLSHVFAALVASAMAPQWALRFLGTAILFGGIQDLLRGTLSGHGSWLSWHGWLERVFGRAPDIPSFRIVTIRYWQNLVKFPVFPKQKVVNRVD